MKEHRLAFLVENVPKYFTHDPDEGKLFWKEKPFRSKVVVGSEAGSINAAGYLHCCLYSTKFMGHSAIWFLETGDWPSLLDHKNGVRSDNRMVNLRIATQQQNTFNSKPIVGTSAYKGVYWLAQKGRWIADIRFNGKRTRIGSFTEEIDAAKAYEAVTKELHGEYFKQNLQNPKGRS